MMHVRLPVAVAKLASPGPSVVCECGAERDDHFLFSQHGTPETLHFQEACISGTCAINFLV